MMTPQERYDRDPEFHHLVDLLTDAITRCQYSPTEIREAAMLACIRYEMQNIHSPYVIDSRTGEIKRVEFNYGPGER
jgi:hypothetical protein